VFFEDRDIDDYVYIKTAEAEGKVLHPTQKPIRLGQYLIKTFTNEGDVVLDNACGSGSFLVAAVLEKRNYIGIEKNEETFLFKKEAINYVKLSEERIEKAKEFTTSNTGERDRCKPALDDL
jgi:DNA modification methylase